MKSSEIAVLRDGIKTAELHGTGKVKVTCVNSSAGEEVYNIISKNFYSLTNGGNLKWCSSGFTMKDFIIKTDSSASAGLLRDNLLSIKNGEPNSIVNPDAENDGKKDNSSNSLSIIAGIVVLIVIGFIIWKKRR